uniref:Ribonuclease H-like domain-containing protein n=1 Tax=Tanacetum cinerariifolium TaxID=118510 RepID=A0A699JXH1_TANCI|nr:ribonuclease H-like domain-containing protein [Tanacetum cinerariifolium]
MNYEPILASTQSNGFAGTKACDNVGQARKNKEPVKDYILLPLWTAVLPFFQDPKSSQDEGFQLSSDSVKKVDEDPCKGCNCKDQEQDDNVNNTNNLNSTNGVNDVTKNISNELPFNPDMPVLEDISIFNLSSDHEDDDDDEEANINNTDTTIIVSPVYTIRIHKDHPLDHDERGIVIRNKARLVAQGHTQEERNDYDEVFSLVARTEAIRLFLAYASFKDFVVYQMDVNSTFLYEKIEEEVLEVKNASTPMETQKPLLKDEDGEEVDVYMYKSLIGLLTYLTSSRPDIMFSMCACARY